MHHSFVKQVCHCTVGHSRSVDDELKMTSRGSAAALLEIQQRHTIILILLWHTHLLRYSFLSLICILLLISYLCGKCFIFRQ